MVAESDKRKERASQQREIRRRQILAASRKVFSRKGYHACSVADLVQEAQIARGTFYLYFRSKRAIFEVLLEEMFSQIRSAVQRVTVEEGEASALDQILGNVQRILRVLEKNRDLTIILLKEAVGLDADFDQKLNAFYTRLSSIIEGALRLGEQMGLVRECDTQLVSYCILGSVKEVMLHRLTGGSRPPLEQVAQEVLRYNLRGVYLPRLEEG